MNSAKTWLIVVLALTTIGGAIVAWRQHGEITALRAATMPRDERAAFQKRVWDLEKANRDLKQQAAGGHDTTAAPTTRPTRGEPSAASRRETEQQAALRDLLAKPELQSLVTLQQRGAVESRYAALFRLLNLPPDQVARVTALLAERTSSLLDIAAVARDQGIDPRAHAAAFQQLVAKEQDAINQSLRGVLGDAGFAQLGTYEQTLTQRNTVNELQQRLSHTATPLAAPQVEQLVQILAANPAPRAAADPSSAATPSQLAAAMADGAVLRALNVQTTGTATITPGAVAQSQSVLSPPQLTALQQMQQQQQAQQQLRKIVSDTLSPTASGKK